MTLEEITNILSEQKINLKNKFKVSVIAIFGSYSRGEQNIHSDIDIMVDFEEPIGIEFIDLADTLENVLHNKVDLVSKKSIKPKLMNLINKELIYV